MSLWYSSETHARQSKPASAQRRKNLKTQVYFYGWAYHIASTLTRNRAFWKRSSNRRITPENVLKAKLSKAMTLQYSCDFPIPETFQNTNPKWPVIIVTFSDIARSRTENVWCHGVFRVKTPFLNFSREVWIGCDVFNTSINVYVSRAG